MILIDQVREKIFSSLSAKELSNISLSSHCRSCLDMAAIPNSFLMAKSMKKKKAAKEAACMSDRQYSTNLDMNNQAPCYNTKMMNSIWGQYNMYSVHNIKAVRTDDEVMYNAPLQQMMQGDVKQNSLNVQQQALHSDFGGYAGQQLVNMSQQPTLKNFVDSLRHEKNGTY